MFPNDTRAMPTGFGMGGCFEQTTTYLFNIIEDPHEANNLAAEHPGIVAELVGLLEAVLAKTERRGDLLPEHLRRVLEIEAATSHRTLDDSIYALYRDWLPQSGEELRDYPCFFHYVNLVTDVKESELITDIHLPIR